MLGSVCCGTTMKRIEMDGGGGDEEKKTDSKSRVDNKPIS